MRGRPAGPWSWNRPSSPATGLAAREAPAPVGDPARAVALLTCATILFALADMMAKILNASLPPGEIAWLRYVASAGVLVPLVAVEGRSALAVTRPGLQVLRGLGILGSAVGFIAAVRYVPLAEATATAFASPIFITMLSSLFLGERPGIRRWSATVLGLAGVIIVVRPFGHGFHWQICYAVLSASSWAVAMVATRPLARADGAIRTMLCTGIVGLAVLSLGLVFDSVRPDPRALALGLLAGAFNTAAQWLAFGAYRAADASLVAPFGYLQIIWAAALGYAVFGAEPDRWTYAGAAVIVASGLYIAHRERVVRARNLAGTQR